jgi:hypothetical protein
MDIRMDESRSIKTQKRAISFRRRGRTDGGVPSA